MHFTSEQTALDTIASLLLDTAEHLFQTTRYLYALSYADFYSCPAQDLFRIVLNNPRDCQRIQALGVMVNETNCAELQGAAYGRLSALIAYSYAVRLPALLHASVQGRRMTGRQIRTVYAHLLRQNAVNYDHLIAETFSEIRNCVRLHRPVPPYTADWYHAFLFSQVPTLPHLDSRSLFLLGAADVLFPLYYLRLEQDTAALLQQLCVTT